MLKKNDWQFLAIEGNIGAGKTSLAEAIAHDYQLNLILETFSNNPFLPKFYDKPEQYAFPLELSFLAERYHQLKKILLSLNLFKPRYVADYTILKSLVFSQINLKEAEYDLFYQLFQIMNEALPQPDYIFYLHSDPDRLQKNIHIRGRTYEKHIANSYLEKIQTGYIESLKKLSDITVILFHVTDADFVNNPSSYKQIIQYLEEKPSQGMHFVEIE